MPVSTPDQLAQLRHKYDPVVRVMHDSGVRVLKVEMQGEKLLLKPVKKGDTLSSISKALYGEANAYRRLFDANRDQLSDPDRILPGQVLRIPE